MIRPAVVLYTLCITALLQANINPALAAEPQIIPTRWTQQEAVTFALTHSPDINIVQQRIAQAKAMAMTAKALALPQIELAAEYGATNNPMYSFGNILNQGAFTNAIDFKDPGVTDTAKLAGQIDYRLYSGGRNEAHRNKATAAIKQEKVSRELTRQELSFAVIHCYQQILLAEQVHATHKEALAAIQASHKVANARYKAGEILKQELFTFAAEQAKEEEQVITAEHQLLLAKRRFLSLLGLNWQPFSLVTEQKKEHIPEVLSTSNRPEWRIMTARKEQAYAQLQQAESGRYPTIDSFARYQMEYGLENDGGGSSWQTGIRLNYPLFDGHATAGAIAAAKAALQKIAAEEQQLKLTISFELEQARLRYQHAKKQLQVSSKREQAAREAVRLSRIQFQEGTLLTAALIDDETRLTEARTHALAAQTEYRIAIANLKRAAGIPQYPNSTITKGDTHREN